MSECKKTTEVSRRSLLKNATIMAGGAAVLTTAMTATSAQADKMAQAAAAYQTKPKDGAQCDGCALFQGPSSCQLVDGTISPSGWCKFWAKKN
jgi:anaerobic selenocysteine-containing dehydrogenase